MDSRSSPLLDVDHSWGPRDGEPKTGDGGSELTGETFHFRWRSFKTMQVKIIQEINTKLNVNHKKAHIVHHLTSS